MRSILLMAFVMLALGGCATPASVDEDAGSKLLNEADAKLAAADYTGAIDSYSQFVTAMGEHPQAARARATQAALERLVAAQAGIARAQQTSDAARREVTERQAETERLKSEVAKLRSDLERLRNIDLKPLRQK
jgi:hypothetical protein